MELMIWEDRLQKEEVPSLNDIHRIAKTSRKIYRVLDKNNVLDVLSAVQSVNK